MTTTQHKPSGVSVRCISSAEVQETIDFLSDWWGPNWRDDKGMRMAMDTLHDAHAHIEAIEEAALANSIRAGREAVQAGIGELLADMRPAFGIPQGDDPDERARKAGAGA